MDESDASAIQAISKWLGSGSINIFGRPFAGKDTQSKKLATLFSATLIGGGDILRSDAMPEHIKQLMTTGRLIPTDDYLAIVLPYLSQAAFAEKPLILNSVGRWHGEEEGVLWATAAAKHPIKAVIALELGEGWVQARWQAAQVRRDRGNRADDAFQLLQVRLEEFRTKTLPVLEFYREKGLLIEVNGARAEAEVTADILDKLNAYSQTH